MSAPMPQLTPVGQLLSAELENRGWTQVDFAAVLGRPTQFVSEIVTGKKEITRESAAQIGAALGQTPEFWLALQDHYLLGEQAKNIEALALTDEQHRSLEALGLTGARIKIGSSVFWPQEVLVCLDTDQVRTGASMDRAAFSNPAFGPRIVAGLVAQLTWHLEAATQES